MRKITVIVAVILIISSCFAGGVTINYKKKSAEVNEPAQQVKTETKYVVKEHNGEIGVFVGEDKIPVKILNIDFDGLREYDKQQFKKGLTLNTLYEVLLLEEDFNS
ncbi:MAG: hypothetical protein J6V58_02260 [Clostridia bacterium]|nr:hypothetical protein [Clostridia bacterium]